MYCKNCGEELVDGLDICPFCKTPVIEDKKLYKKQMEYYNNLYNRRNYARHNVSQSHPVLITLLLIIGIMLFIYICGNGYELSTNGSETSNEKIFALQKEDRSTYIAKCSTISYDSLARNPNQYKGNNYTFTGKVIQVMENNNEITLRVNVTPKRYEYINETFYEDTILVNYKYSSSYESKILEDDIITIYGKSMGTYTYEAILGNSVTIPMINAMYIDVR